MNHSNRLLRLSISALLALSPIGNAIAVAQTGEQVTFELRPHCIDADHAAASETFGGEVPPIDGITTLTENSALPCPSYEVRDPLSKQTGILKVGDTLDMDLVIYNPKALPLKRYRVWLAYDSNVLEGTSLDLSNAFAVPTPGETDFSLADNYIKASASSAQPVTQTKIVVAHVVMKVKTAPQNGVILSFYDSNGTATAHTGAFAPDAETEKNVASPVQGALAVLFAATATSASSITSIATGSGTTSSVPAVSSASSVVPASSAASSSSTLVFAPTTSSAPASSVTSSSSVAAVPTVFTKLQVQALRVTTEGSSAFLAWNPLPSSELAGYNLYYGSISGRYLQRRSVDKEAQTLTIRALPVGMTYYFAVRAVNGAGAESDFSQEVAVTIGNPATSTSPLSGNLIEGPQGNAPGTGGTVSGESGPGSWIAILTLLSAVLGTAFAFRRQWTASSAIPR